MKIMRGKLCVSYPKINCHKTFANINQNYHKRNSTVNKDELEEPKRLE